MRVPCSSQLSKLPFGLFPLYFKAVNPGTAADRAPAVINAAGGLGVDDLGDSSSRGVSLLWEVNENEHLVRNLLLNVWTSGFLTCPGC